MGHFKTDLDVDYLPSGGWRLDEPLIYYSKVFGGDIIVPKDFVTDFASVPRIPVIYAAMGDKGHRAATVHDFMYSRLVTRSLADSVFLEALKDDGLGWFTRNAMWAGVRLGGWTRYLG